MIVHVFNSSLVSGPETLVLPGLAQFKSEEILIIFLSETRRGSDSEKPVHYAKSLGLSILEIRVRSRMDFRAIAELRREILKHKVSIVHAHDVKASTYSWMASFPNRKWKLISTHHGVGRSGFKLKAYERFYSTAVLRGYDRVLTVCSSDRDELIRRGFPPEKISVHLNGVNRPKVNDEQRLALRKEMRKRWNLSLEDEVLAFGIVGRLDPEKNHRQALEVFAKVQSLNPKAKWKILCFGIGECAEALVKQTLDLQLSDRVVWMGYRAHLGQEFVGFDGLLSFSNTEGLPINLLEAGWAGLSVFSTGVGGILDLMRDQIDGDVLPKEWTIDHAAQRLRLYIDDSGRRKRMALTFQDRVIKEFSEEAWLKRLTELYNQVRADTPKGRNNAYK